MELIDLMQNNIDHIEVNLKLELSLDELAANAGFSVYHYCRIFASFTGMPVAAYVTKRRLLHIIYEAQMGKSLIDAALEYGFDTHAGFYKAFRREFGCSPSKYMKLASVEKPLRIDLRQEAKIMLTHKQIKQILTNWDIGITSSIEETEVVTADGTAKSDRAWYIGEDYVLKTYKSIGRLRTHAAISKALSDSRLTIGSIMPTKENADFFQEGDYFYVLMTRAPGRFLTPEERYNGNRFEIGKKYGTSIGVLHNALKKFDKAIEVNDTNFYKIVMEWAMPQARRLMTQWGHQLPEEFYTSYSNDFTRLYKKLPRQIIHRDPNPSNILWDAGEVSSFIDFEISERNVRLFDPCYCATGILSEAQNVEGGYDKWPELLSGIIKGYDSMCVLTPEEKQAVPFIVYSIQLIFIAWLDSQSKDKRLAEINRNILSWLWNNKDRWKYFL